MAKIVSLDDYIAGLVALQKEYGGSVRVLRDHGHEPTTPEYCEAIDEEGIEPYINI